MDHAARARQRQEAGDLAGAMEEVRQALRLDPRNAEAVHVRAHIRRDRGQFRRAIWDFRRAARLAPGDYRNFY
jgi:Tfp pilus assembly protein PilF